MPPPPRDPARRRLLRLFDRADEPAFALDAEARLTYLNPALEAAAGIIAADALGRRCRPGAAAEGFPLGEALAPPPEAADGRPVAGLARLGPGHYRRLHLWPRHDPQGRLLGYAGQLGPPGGEPGDLDAPSTRLRAELARALDCRAGRAGADLLAGSGPAHRRLLDQVDAAAATTTPVLILGEPGTGRRTVAAAIHGRRGPLVPVDAPALGPAEIDRLLRAEARPDGPVTLLLLDACTLPRDLQATLSNTDAGVFRLLAIDTKEPDQAYHSGLMKLGYYYLLTTAIIRLAPLRDRLDELPLLAQHRLERAEGPGPRGFRPEALEILGRHDWPGNLRELGRVIDAAHARATGPLIGPDDLPATLGGPRAGAYLPPPMPAAETPLDEALERVERSLIARALAASGGNKSKAAASLRISRPRLHRRITELGMADPPPSDPDGGGPGPTR